MKHRGILLRAAALGLALALLAGCSAAGTDSSVSAQTFTDAEQTSTASVSALDPTSLFSDRDLDGSYDPAEAVAITLTGDSAACDSTAVTIDGSRITLTEEGVYLVSGTLADGQLIVDAGDEDKVQIVLDGASVTSSTSAALYVRNADKVFVTLAEGSSNTLANGGEYVDIDENSIDGAVFSKSDLTLNGSGSLTVSAAAGHGVVCKDTLVITGGSYTVTAEKQGLSGKEGVAVAAGTFDITSGTDGIHAENTDDASLAFVYIADGSFSVAAQGDAVSAGGALQIDGGTFELTTGEGSASVELTSSDSAGGQRGGFDPAAQSTTAADADAADETSQKGIKGEGSFAINGGVFVVDTVDDCLHGGSDMTITAGTFTLSSGDDAVHADGALTISGGSFTIPYSYEGLEGQSVTVTDGEFDITSSDDGINAAGGADSSGFGGGRTEQFTSGSDSFILIEGGSFTIVSGGDCVDSNGDLTIAGGTLDLVCNGAGNTALDTDGTYTHSGGTVTTNDGSEENPGAMGGGGGRGDMGGGTLPDGSAPDGTAPEGGTAGKGGQRPGQNAAAG